MSRSFGGASPFGVQLKNKKTVRTGETVKTGFGVTLKKTASSQSANEANGNIKLKSFDKDTALTSNGSSTKAVSAEAGLSISTIPGRMISSGVAERLVVWKISTLFAFILHFLQASVSFVVRDRGGNSFLIISSFHDMMQFW